MSIEVGFKERIHLYLSELLISSVEERQWKELTVEVDFLSFSKSASLRRIIGDEEGAGTSSATICTRLPKREGKSLFYRYSQEASREVEAVGNATSSDASTIEQNEQHPRDSDGQTAQCSEPAAIECPTNSVISEIVSIRCRQGDLANTIMESRGEMANSWAALANFPHEVSPTRQRLCDLGCDLGIYSSW